MGRVNPERPLWNGWQKYQRRRPMPKRSDLHDSLSSDGDGGNDINDAWTRTHDNQPNCGRSWEVSTESCTVEEQKKSEI